MRSTLTLCRAASNQREGFRRYLAGLLLPTERHKTLTGLVNTEPLVGAKPPRAQRLQWFLSESDWDERKVQAERLTLLLEDPSTAPDERGVLVIDETGVSLDGHHTAHVGRQYLANLGKIDNGVVSVTSLCVWITLLMTGWSSPPRIQANEQHCRAKKHQRR